MRRALLVCAAITFAIACTDNITEPTPDRSAASGGSASRAPTVAFATTTTEDGLSISTDKDDYQPGNTVHLTGSGWPANEVLDIKLDDEPLTHPPHTWTLTTADDGTFHDSTYVVDYGDIDVKFTLTATTRSQPTRSLTVQFTDGNPGIPTVGAQSPSAVNQGSTATYLVTVNFVGNSELCTVILRAEPTASPVWPGTPDFVFSPSSLTSAGGGGGGINLTSTLTVTAPAGPAATTYKFRITVDQTADEDDCQGTNEVTGDISLVVAGPANAAPILAAIGNKTVAEETQLAFTATATDENPSTLAFTLANPATGTFPTGASITSGGAFTWTPTEAQGPGTYRAKVVVTDAGLLTDFEEIQITVSEVNIAPQLAAIGSKTVDELSALMFTTAATDDDVPANDLTFSLAGAPAGASINSTTGAFSWTPTEAQGPGTYSFSVKVTDNGAGLLSDDELITVTVNEVNVAPTLTNVPSTATIDELDPYSFDANATDTDLPAQTLTFSLVGGPAGAAIASDGKFSWTPTEAQGPGEYDFKVRVSDGIDDTEAPIKITVSEVNVAPALALIGNKSTEWGDQLSFTATATDTDLPANTLTFSLAGSLPTGASIAADGAFTWTPTAAQIGSHSITVRVTDDGSPVMYDEEIISVTVSKRATMLTYSGATSGLYGGSIGVAATLLRTTGGAAVEAKSISFTLGTLGISATTQSGGAAGLASTALTLAQNVGSYSVVSTFTEDAEYLGSSDTDPFAINPAPLSIKADNKTMFFGASAPPAFTVTPTGFVLGEGTSVLGGTLTFSGTGATANSSTPVGSYVITPGGYTSTNYAISFVSGTLSVIYNNLVGHQFLQPINPNLTAGNRSSFKVGAVIPTKFQIFRADGTTPVTTAIAKISVFKIDNVPETQVNEELLAIPADDGIYFRVSGGQYIYNLGTKNWSSGTYRIVATLDDLSTIEAVVDARSR